MRMHSYFMNHRFIENNKKNTSPHKLKEEELTRLKNNSKRRFKCTDINGN